MCQNGVFFTPVKYTLVSRVPGFLGEHDTLPCTVTQATIIEAIVHFLKKHQTFFEDSTMCSK